MSDPVPSNRMGKATKETSWTGTIVMGALLAVVGLVIVLEQLGRQEQWSPLLRRFIGGPDAQTVLLASLLAVAGVVVAGYGWWRRRADT